MPGGGRRGWEAWSRRGCGASGRARVGVGCRPASVREDGGCTESKELGDMSRPE